MHSFPTRRASDLRKQHDLLLYIHDKLETTGVSPSFEEMKEAMKLKPKSGIHRLVTGLEERGFIRRLAHRARALEVLRRSEERRVGKKGDMTCRSRWSSYH